MEKGKRKKGVGEATGLLRSFEDLDAWQQCRRVYFLTYKLTKKFPDEEKFSLTSQMRRAAVSAASNIAEGFGRTTKSDKSHFYVMARGSLTELQNQCILANDVNLISDKDLGTIRPEVIRAHKMVVGLIKVTKT